MWIRRWNAYVPQILDVAPTLSTEAGTDPAARDTWRIAWAISSLASISSSTASPQAAC